MAAEVDVVGTAEKLVFICAVERTDGTKTAGLDSDV